MPTTCKLHVRFRCNFISYCTLFGSVIGYESKSISVRQGVVACRFVLSSDTD